MSAYPARRRRSFCVRLGQRKTVGFEMSFKVSNGNSEIVVAGEEDAVFTAER